MYASLVCRIAQEQGPFQSMAAQIYHDLRDNVVHNVFQVHFQYTGSCLRNGRSVVVVVVLVVESQYLILRGCLNLLSALWPRAQQYQKTGYIWEQYNDVTGAGQSSHPFTGWSALVVLIMAEKY